MAVQITLIGLGRIGGSMGLALGEYGDKIVRVGHDRDPAVEREALKRGVMDRAGQNAARAVEGSKLVILSLPVTEIRAVLEAIIPALQPGCVVLDTAPVKADVAAWAKELLPKDVYHLGIVPTPGFDYFREDPAGLSSARAEMFNKSIFYLSASPNAPAEAVQLASDFVRLLGAAPLLCDFAESDGLVSTAMLMPQLVSAAFLGATAGRPGWDDSRKAAGRAFNAVSSAFDYEDLEALAELLRQNRANISRSLNGMIQSLQALHADLERGDAQTLLEWFETARRDRDAWLTAKRNNEWMELERSEAFDMPSMSERLFGGMFTPRKKK